MKKDTAVPSHKIRVVFGLPSLGIGGIEKQLIDQLFHLNQDEFDANVITLFDTRFDLRSAPSLYEKIPLHIGVHRLDFKGATDIRSWYRLFRLLRQLRPQVVVTSVFSANATFRLLKPFCGYKCITSEHSIPSDRRTYHRLIDFVLSFITYKIIAVSEGVKKEILAQTHIRPERVVVIHNGTDLKKIQQLVSSHEGQISEMKRAVGFAPDDRIVVNVARLKAVKDHKLLIDSFEIFSRSHPSYKLAIVGSGEEFDELERHIKECGLAERVVLFGYRADVYLFYAISDFFVLTSRKEGFALVGIEAMAFGLPVISTRTAGPVEYVKSGENGYLAAWNPDDIAGKMGLLAALSPDERRRFTEHCVQTANLFSIEENVKQYESLFREAARA